MGCFDLLHYGHLKYFEWARSLMADVPLTVALTADAYFNPRKGPHRPAFPEQIRAEWLSFVGIVDYVAIVYEPTAVLAINTIKPAIYAKGHEAEGMIPVEVAATEAHGGKVMYMPNSNSIYSSGRILSGEYLRLRSTQRPKPSDVFDFR